MARCDLLVYSPKVRGDTKKSCAYQELTRGRPRTSAAKALGHLHRANPPVSLIDFD